MSQAHPQCDSCALLTRVFNAFTSSSLLPQTIDTILLEFPITAQSERGVFWDEATQRHTNPLREVEGGFWYASWDVKVRLALLPHSEVDSVPAQDPPSVC